MAVALREVGRRFGCVRMSGWVAGSSLAVVCGLECPTTPVVEAERGGCAARCVWLGGRLLASRLVRAGVPGCARERGGQRGGRT